MESGVPNLQALCKKIVFLVARRQTLVAWGLRALLEHSPGRVFKLSQSEIVITRFHRMLSVNCNMTLFIIYGKNLLAKGRFNAITNTFSQSHGTSLYRDTEVPFYLWPLISRSTLSYAVAHDISKNLCIRHLQNNIFPLLSTQVSRVPNVVSPSEN